MTRYEKRFFAITLLVGYALILLMAIVRIRENREDELKSLEKESAIAIEAEMQEVDGKDERANEVIVLEVPMVSYPANIQKQNTYVEPTDESWLISEIALDYDTQRLLKQACDEMGVDFHLALAVIWTETRYQNINGDGGNSIGYMQIQPRWHYDRMERLGVTDLSDPLSNFRVGCNLLAELLTKYSTTEALTAYNSGQHGQSSYAEQALIYMQTLKK